MLCKPIRTDMVNGPGALVHKACNLSALSTLVNTGEFLYHNRDFAIHQKTINEKMMMWKDFN